MSKYVNDGPFRIKEIRTLMYLLPCPEHLRRPKKTHYNWRMMPDKTCARNKERLTYGVYQWLKHINNKPIPPKDITTLMYLHTCL